LPMTSTSVASTGLASATPGCAATRAKSCSSKPLRGPSMAASASPFTSRSAALNSASAAVLMRLTA
jgi:hypothetical protein